jgi:hypothetical protein
MSHPRQQQDFAGHSSVCLHRGTVAASAALPHTVACGTQRHAQRAAQQCRRGRSGALQRAAPRPLARQEWRCPLGGGRGPPARAAPPAVLGTPKERALAAFLAAGPHSDNKLSSQLVRYVVEDDSGVCVRMLLAAGARVDGRDTVEGLAPLDHAMRAVNPAATRALLDAGADPCAVGKGGFGLVAGLMLVLPFTPDMAAKLPHRSTIAVLTALAAHRDVTRCVLGGAPKATLLMAVDTGREDCVKLLLAAGAHPDDITGADGGQSALMLAVTHPLAELYVGNDAVATPLCTKDAAGLDKALRLVRTLLRAGANTRQRCAAGKLPIKFVAVTGDLRVADAILAAEAKKGLPPLVACSRDASEARWLAGLVDAVEAFRSGGATACAVLPEALRDVDYAHIMQSEAVYEVVPTTALQAAAATTEVTRCAARGCTAVGVLLRLCKGCKRVHYCGAACQKLHWGEGHKTACGMAARAVAAPAPALAAPAATPLLS